LVDPAATLLASTGAGVTWWPSLLGTVAGAIIALAGAFGLEQFKRIAERKRLAFAIGAEVLANVRMVHFRKYTETLQACAAAARDGSSILVSVNIPNDYMAISRAAADRIGLLPGKVGYQTAELLVLASAVKADMDTLIAWSNANADPAQLDLEPTYEALSVILTRFLQVGSQLLDELHVIYSDFNPRPWPEVDAPVIGLTPPA
jgi:hypothetical protein